MIEAAAGEVSCEFTKIIPCRPAITLRPSSDTHIAAPACKRATSAEPLSGPRRSKVVDSASESVADLVVTLTAKWVRRGVPLAGTTIWRGEWDERKPPTHCAERRTR